MLRQQIKTNVSLIANGRTRLSIDCDGSVYPCNLFISDPKWAMGNIGDQRILDIWFSQKWSFFRGDVKISELVRCRNCKDLNKCRDFFCRLLPYVENGNPLGPHPKCGWIHRSPSSLGIIGESSFRATFRFTYSNNIRGTSKTIINSQYCDRKTPNLSTGSISPPTCVGGFDVVGAGTPLSVGPGLIVNASRLILLLENGNFNARTFGTQRRSLPANS